MHVCTASVLGTEAHERWLLCHHYWTQQKACCTAAESSALTASSRGLHPTNTFRMRTPLPSLLQLLAGHVANSNADAGSQAGNDASRCALQVAKQEAAPADGQLQSQTTFFLKCADVSHITCRNRCPTALQHGTQAPLEQSACRHCSLISHTHQPSTEGLCTWPQGCSSDLPATCQTTS